MAEQLHQNANTTPPSEKNPETFPLSTRTKIILGTAIILIAFVALGFMASQSIPGSALYGIKTGVIEGLTESMQPTAEAKASYQTVKLRERLEELKTLIQKGTVEANMQDDLRAMVTQHTQTLESLVEAEADAPTPAMLSAISDFSDVAAAMETRSEREESLSEFGEFMEDVRRNAVNLYQDHVDRYVERETPEVIYEFVRTLLTNVSSEINNAGLSEGTIDDAEVYINRVGAAMAEGNYPRAITAIAEAKRFIMIEKYGVLEVTEETTSSTTTTSSSTTTTSPTSTTEVEITPLTTPNTAAPQSAPSFTFPE